MLQYYRQPLWSRVKVVHPKIDEKCSGVGVNPTSWLKSQIIYEQPLTRWSRIFSLVLLSLLLSKRQSIIEWFTMGLFSYFIATASQQMQNGLCVLQWSARLSKATKWSWSNRGIKKSSLWVSARSFKGVSPEVSSGLWTLSFFSHML